MFVNPNTAVGNTQAPNAAPTKEKRTTLGYINLYVPTADGGRVKLANDLTIRLYAENKADATLVELIKNGTITEAQLGSMIVAEITLARDPNAEITFDLSAFVPKP